MRKVTLLLILLLVVFMAVPAFADHFGFGMSTTQGSRTPGVVAVAQSGSLSGSVSVGPGMVGSAGTTISNEGYGFIGDPVLGTVAGTQSSTTASVDTSQSTGSGFVAAGAVAATNTVAFVNGTSGPASSHVGWGFGVNW